MNEKQVKRLRAAARRTIHHLEKKHTGGPRAAEVVKNAVGDIRRDWPNTPHCERGRFMTRLMRRGFAYALGFRS
jgi:hypothetical protein